MNKKNYHGVGKRKTSIARVFLSLGKGKILINDRKLDIYTPSSLKQQIIKSPLLLTENNNLFDIKINVQGGGFSSQVTAIKLGIAKALLKFNINLRPTLKKAKMLTRDSRKKERKHVNHIKARKSTQYSKR